MNDDPKGVFLGSYNTQARTVRLTLKLKDEEERLVLTTSEDGSITFYDPFEEPILTFDPNQPWDGPTVFDALNSTWQLPDMGMATMNAFTAFMQQVTPLIVAMNQAQEDNGNAEGDEREETGRRPTLQ